MTSLSPKVQGGSPLSKKGISTSPSGDDEASKQNLTPKSKKAIVTKSQPEDQGVSHVKIKHTNKTLKGGKRAISAGYDGPVDGEQGGSHHPQVTKGLMGLKIKNKVEESKPPNPRIDWLRRFVMTDVVKPLINKTPSVPRAASRTPSNKEKEHKKKDSGSKWSQVKVMFEAKNAFKKTGSQPEEAARPAPQTEEAEEMQRTLSNLDLKARLKLMQHLNFVGESGDLEAEIPNWEDEPERNRSTLGSDQQLRPKALMAGVTGHTDVRRHNSQTPAFMKAKLKP